MLEAESIKTRDKVVTLCSECGTSSTPTLNALKRQIKKLGAHLCWSCSARKATIRAKVKYETTMIAKYGAVNPNQVPEIKAKIKATNLERYGEEGSIGLAREAFYKKYGVDNPLKIEEIKEKVKKINSTIRDGKRTCLGCKITLPISEFRLRGKYHISRCDSCYREKARSYYPKYSKNRKLNDINYKISGYLRSRLLASLKKQNKTGSAVRDLGCSIEFLKQYLESKFKPGMTWSNHGKWHIDHIIPLSAFDLTIRKELLKACHYTNLQPLWAYENILKGGIKKKPL